MQQIFLGLGAVAKKTYVDDVFSTFLYKGQSTPSTVTTGIDMTEGGMVWVKNRSSGNHAIGTKELGAGYLVPNGQSALDAFGNGFNTFTSTGFTTTQGNVQPTNENGNNYASWNWKKTPGFFDVVTYTGNGTAGRTVSHQLGSVPGFIIVKQTNGVSNWSCYHKQFGAGGGYIELNGTDAKNSDSNAFSTTAPTSTLVTLGSDAATNGNTNEYVMYLFAGGVSTAATSRSVDFGGSPGDQLSIASTSDFGFGTGDFTIEFWLKWETGGSSYPYILDMRDSGSDFGTTNRVVLLIRNPSQDFKFMLNGSFVLESTDKIARDTWNHFAVVRNSGTTSLYVNGISNGSFSDSTNYGNAPAIIGQKKGNDNPFSGKISNLRIVKGTAVYTSSFKPTYEPLTNITNTKLLCCNNTSITGSTVTPSTISSNGTVTASTDSPFDDPAGFVFGDSGTENLIKCGSYKTDSSEDATVNLGWEPQWVLTKRTDSSAGGDWLIYDSMRGLLGTVGESGGGSVSLSSNTTSGDNDNNRIKINSTGFYQDDYGANRSYLFVAIRRSDGYVGKPVELGSGCFQMDTGSGSSSIPTYDSGFPVDFAVARTYASSNNWNAVTRLRPKYFLRLNTTNAGPLDHSDYRMDSNVGWARSDNSTFQSWMWKRHAGFDVVYYKPSGNNGYQVRHNLSKTPEMIWIKNRNSTTNWIVGHKDANGGTNPWDYYLNLDGSGQNVNWSWTYSTPPTATAVTLASSTSTNNASYNYIMMLFASVSGISAVGSYTGNGSTSERSFDLGFEPRFFMVKNTTTGSTDWLVIDSLRGFNTNSTDGELLSINNTSAQTGSNEIRKHSNGFKIVSYSSGTLVNANSSNYIYYAHA